NVVFLKLHLDELAGARGKLIQIQPKFDAAWNTHMPFVDEAAGDQRGAGPALDLPAQASLALPLLRCLVDPPFMLSNANAAACPVDKLGQQNAGGWIAGNGQNMPVHRDRSAAQQVLLQYRVRSWCL